MITFVSESRNRQLHEAMKKAEELLKSGSEFLKTVEKINHFAMTNLSGAELVQVFQRASVQIHVQLYRPTWLFSRALGYSIKETDVVYINYLKLRRPHSSLVATIIHEALHALNHYDEIHQFGHRDNHSQGKDDTASYKLDAIAEAIIDLEDQKEGAEELEDDKVANKHDSFVFYNGAGHEIPRSALYQLTKDYLKDSDET
jgi:hypothetical protein